MHVLDWSRWSLSPTVVAGLALTGWLYARGLRRLWRRAGPGEGVSRWQAASFSAGWTAVAVALVSPLHRLGENLFSAHMIQHGVLMMVAAPLWVLGRPLVVFLWAFPSRARERIGRATRSERWRRAWRRLTSPVVAFLLQSLALWIWHVPALWEAALRSGVVHAIQHGSFLVASGIFWWALVHGRFGRQGYGVAAAAVFATAVESGVLGALITVARSLWYPIYASRTAAAGRSPLEDQQLAGIIMWIPAGFVLVGFGLALFAAWLGEAERRVAWAEDVAWAEGKTPAVPAPGRIEDRHAL